VSVPDALTAGFVRGEDESTPELAQAGVGRHGIHTEWICPASIGTKIDNAADYSWPAWCRFAWRPPLLPPRMIATSPGELDGHKDR